MTVHDSWYKPQIGYIGYDIMLPQSRTHPGPNCKKRYFPFSTTHNFQKITILSKRHGNLDLAEKTWLLANE